MMLLQVVDDLILSREEIAITGTVADLADEPLARVCMELEVEITLSWKAFQSGCDGIVGEQPLTYGGLVDVRFLGRGRHGFGAQRCHGGEEWEGKALNSGASGFR